MGFELVPLYINRMLRTQHARLLLITNWSGANRRLHSALFVSKGNGSRLQSTSKKREMIWNSNKVGEEVWRTREWLSLLCIPKSTTFLSSTFLLWPHFFLTSHLGDGGEEWQSWQLMPCQGRGAASGTANTRPIFRVHPGTEQQNLLLCLSQNLKNRNNYETDFFFWN